MLGKSEAELRTGAAEAVARGSLLFHLDLAAALAEQAVATTDLVAELPVLAVDIGPRGYEVDVLSADLTRDLARIGFAADGRAMLEPSHGAPTARARRIGEAIRTLGRLDPHARAVVLPPHEDGSEAYLFVQPEDVGDIVVGVHHRLRLTPDGRTVLAQTPLSRAPLVIPGANGKPAFDIVLTHLLGDTPSEVHVYLSLKHAVALNVITAANEEYWQIDGERISLL